MQVFQTQRRIYLINELKHWALTIVVGLALLFIFSSFTFTSQSGLLSGICFLSILHLSDTIVQYHVKEIRIVPDSKQITFILSSIMSGKEIRSYDISQVHSEIMKSSSFASLFGYGTIVRISLPANKYFRITARYGFSENTLADIDAGIKKIQASE